MKKFISVITMFILSITLLSAPVQAEVNKTEVLDALELSDLTPVETISSYEYDVLEAVEKNMKDFEVILVNSDFYEELHIYALVPKHKHFLYIADDAYSGDVESIEFWNEFTGILSESSVLIQTLASQGTENKYAVMILNPENYEHFIWMGFDGEVVYDYVNDINDFDVLLD